MKLRKPTGLRSFPFAGANATNALVYFCCCVDHMGMKDTSERMQSYYENLAKEG